MAWLIPGRVAAAFVFPPYEWGRPGLWTSGKGEGFGSFQYMILGMQLAMNGDADFPRIRKLVSSYQPLRESISELRAGTGQNKHFNVVFARPRGRGEEAKHRLEEVRRKQGSRGNIPF